MLARFLRSIFGIEPLFAGDHIDFDELPKAPSGKVWILKLNGDWELADREPVIVAAWPVAS